MFFLKKPSLVICGDFNASIGASLDYIDGVDMVPERHTLNYQHNISLVMYQHNNHGESLLNLLLGSKI